MVVTIGEQIQDPKSKAALKNPAESQKDRNIKAYKKLEIAHNELTQNVKTITNSGTSPEVVNLLLEQNKGIIGSLRKSEVKSVDAGKSLSPSSSPTSSGRKSPNSVADRF